MSPEEIAGETIYREPLYATGGRYAVDRHIVELMLRRLEIFSDERSHNVSALGVVAGKPPKLAVRCMHEVHPSE